MMPSALPLTITTGLPRRSAVALVDARLAWKSAGGLVARLRRQRAPGRFWSGVDERSSRGPPGALLLIRTTLPVGGTPLPMANRLAASTGGRGAGNPFSGWGRVAA